MEYEEIVQRDIEIHWIILDFCEQNPWIKDHMNIIISKYPWQDICILVPIAYIWGLFEIGPHFFWVCAINIGVSFVARKLLEVKRPVEYDRRLKPLTDTNAESYGFPSIESYMSVVVFGLLMQKFPHLWFTMVAFCCILLVGFSRIYSRARFPHQIVGSWIAGFMGLQIVGNLVKNHMKIEKMVRLHQWWLVGMVCMIGLIHLALCIENNDSRLAHVPKQEFQRVLTDIMNGTTTTPEDNVSTIRDRDGTLRRVRKSARDRVDNTGVYPDADADSIRNGGMIDNRSSLITPRGAAIRQAVEAQQQAELRRSSKYYDRVKHDSFYHLQKSMMLREARLKGDAGDSLLNDEEYMPSPSATPRNITSRSQSDSARDISFRDYRTARSSGSSRQRNFREERKLEESIGRMNSNSTPRYISTGTTPRV